jgi:hypothetical protein
MIDMEELKMTRIAIDGPYGDYSLLFGVSTNKECTLREFIDLVLTKHECGYVKLVSATESNLSRIMGRHPRLDYENTQITSSNIPESYWSKKVASIKGLGGWGMMDYNIILE